MQCSGLCESCRLWFVTPTSSARLPMSHRYASFPVRAGPLRMPVLQSRCTCAAIVRSVCGVARFLAVLAWLIRASATSERKKPLRLCRPWHNSGTSLMYFPLRGGRQKLKGSAVVTMTGLGCAKGKAIVQHDQWPVKWSEAPTQLGAMAGFAAITTF